ncbi:hypothetical protein EJ04DRAFT_513353 [Polyplosphaeria fusca]|uniref:DUF7709 domain-containing protein n=1 Tax=Polyplosphaeria fusca TaxID=682080 RepID=A0A9P4V2F6_9PLEO|nr:hypothetical protein EJ04DRAFT_513353 [Polyplosphaeria fusca]
MSTSNQVGDKLADVNSSTLGADMPQVTLPGGRKVQTGTVAALIVNIKLYDEIVTTGIIEEAKKAQLEEKMAASLPVLRLSGIFDIFPPNEWIAGSSAGRKFVGELAAKEGL